MLEHRIDVVLDFADRRVRRYYPRLTGGQFLRWSRITDIADADERSACTAQCATGRSTWSMGAVRADRALGGRLMGGALLRDDAADAVKPNRHRASSAVPWCRGSGGTVSTGGRPVSLGSWMTRLIIANSGNGNGRSQ